MTTTRTLICVAGIALSLTACGGGGGGSTSTAAAPAPIIPAPSIPAVTSFSNLVPPTSFTWSSQQRTSTSGIAITQSSGATLGNVRVTVSNFIDTDPTGSGAAMAPMSTDVLTYALGGSNALPSAVISFGTLALPSSTQQVLVEVFSAVDGSKLGGGTFSVSSLLAGSAALTL